MDKVAYIRQQNSLKTRVLLYEVPRLQIRTGILRLYNEG